MSMHTEPLSLSHQELLSSRFKALRLSISEYSFANAYLFRKRHELEVVFGENDIIFLRGTSYDGARYLMPAFDLREISLNELKEYLATVDFLFPIPEEWLSSFDKTALQSTFLEEDSDYIFLTEKIRTYAGRHLGGRRNLVHQCLDLYQPIGFSLTDQHKNDALQVLDAWRNHLSDEVENTDYSACKEAIELQGELALQGKIYYADKKPIAFILGEPLNNEMFVVHFTKADIQLKGIYQYVYQDFAKSLDDHFTYLNWEQDLGKEGLRHSKSAYLPDKMLKKMRVS